MNENEKNPAMTENAVAEGAVENPEIETPAAENTATKTESEAAPAENAAPEEGAENATTEVPAENTAPAEEDEPAASSEFTLTANQLRDEVYNALLKVQVPSRWDNECMIPKYWLTDIQGSEVIVTDSGTYQLMGIPYSMNGDNVVLEYENIKRKKVIYEDWDNGDVMPGLITMFSTLTDKLVELSDSFTKAANEVS